MVFLFYFTLWSIIIFIQFFKESHNDYEDADIISGLFGKACLLLYCDILYNIRKIGVREILYYMKDFYS